MPGRFWRCGFALCCEKADMPACSRYSYRTQPIDPTIFLAVTTMLALSESERRDRFKEASDTLHRTCCTNSARPPSRSSTCLLRSSSASRTLRAAMLQALHSPHPAAVPAPAGYHAGARTLPRSSPAGRSGMRRAAAPGLGVPWLRPPPWCSCC